MTTQLLRPFCRIALFHRRYSNTMATVCGAILLGMTVIAVFAPLLAPYDPNSQNLLGRLKAPGTEVRGVLYLLGSDELGRDLLSRIIYGARISLFVAISSVAISGTFGVFLGMISGYYRGRLGAVIMRIVDIVLSVPPILLAIITVAALGPGLTNVILVLAFTRWPRYARVAYGQSLSVVNMPYVRVAKFMGSPSVRILFRHVLPNIIGPILVVATLEFGLMILFEAGLSFLGLGVQPPQASWGAILSVGRNYLSTAWWISTFPGICLFLVVLSINIIGDRASDIIGSTSSRSK